MTSDDRARLRQIIDQADSLAAGAASDHAIDQVVRSIDARLGMARLAAPRSNRAKGAVRTLTQKRQALLDRVKKQRDQIDSARADADLARRQLVAGAPHDLAAAVDAARRRLDDAQWHAQMIPAGAPLQVRVHAEELLRLATQRHDAALLAATAWDPSPGPTPDQP